MGSTMTDNDEYLDVLCAFINIQDYLGRVSVDALRTSRTREELGITSLAVIMLVANYMQASGVSHMEFNPDWVGKLDYVEGIVAVFREIDQEKDLLSAK